MIKRIVSLLVFLLVCQRRLSASAWSTSTTSSSRTPSASCAILSGQPPTKSDEVIKAKVMDLAQDNQIPLDPDYRRGVAPQCARGLGEKITIKFAYAVMVPVVPGFERRFDFDYTTP